MPRAIRALKRALHLRRPVVGNLKIPKRCTSTCVQKCVQVGDVCGSAVLPEPVTPDLFGAIECAAPARWVGFLLWPRRSYTHRESSNDTVCLSRAEAQSTIASSNCTQFEQPHRIIRRAAQICTTWPFPCPEQTMLSGGASPRRTGSRAPPIPSARRSPEVWGFPMQILSSS